MGLGGKTKTYVSASISNVFTEDAEEMRTAILAGLESISDHELDKDRWTVHVNDVLLHSNGTKYRNYCYWSKNYKYTSYHEEYFADTDKTYAELIGFVEPSVSTSDMPSDEDMSALLQRDYEYNPDLEEYKTEYKMCNCITATGSVVVASIPFVTYKKDKYKIISSYSGKYNTEKAGEAYIWSTDEYIEDNAPFIYAENTTYNVSPASSFSDDEGNSLGGGADDIVIQLGYTVQEEHTLVEGEGEPEMMDIFYDTKSELVHIKQVYPDNGGNYFILAAYIYSEYYAQNYEKEGDLIKLDENLKPIPIENSFEITEFEYEFSRESYDSVLVDYYTSTIDIESVRPVGICIPATQANADSIISNMFTDHEPVDLKIAPPVCFKCDKRWLDENGDEWWYNVSDKALTKVSADWDYIDTLFENLYPTGNSSEDIAYVYLLYGLPTNMCQLDYCAKYALQFFKQLLVPGWEAIARGQDYTYSVGGRGYSYDAHSFNFHFQFSVGGATYVSGSGKCPCKSEDDRDYSDAGYAWYNGADTIWRQLTNNAWEYIQIRGYSTTFAYIKNGKSAGIGSNGWGDKLWENEAIFKRNYSKAIIPVSAEIAKNIPFTAWTDMTQYIGHIGVTCYKVVKTKWYQTGLFKIVLIIIVIVVTVVVSYFCPPAGAAVGSMGFGAILFDVLISVAISIACAVVINTFLKPILVKLLGNFWGNLISAIATIIASYYVINFTLPSNSLVVQGMGSITDYICSFSGFQQLTSAYFSYRQDQIAEQAEEETKNMNAYMDRLNAFNKETDELKEEYGLVSSSVDEFIQQMYLEDQKYRVSLASAEQPGSFVSRTIDFATNYAENLLYYMDNKEELVTDYYISNENLNTKTTLLIC